MCQRLISLLYFITNCTKCVSFISNCAFVRINDGNLKFVSKEKPISPLGVLIFDRDRLSVSPIQRSFRGRGLLSKRALCWRTDRKFLKLIGSRKREESPSRANRRNNRGIHLPRAFQRRIIPLRVESSRGTGSRIREETKPTKRTHRVPWNEVGERGSVSSVLLSRILREHD